MSLLACPMGCSLCLALSGLYSLLRRKKTAHQTMGCLFWRAWRDSTRLRCPTSVFGNKLPCHLSTAAQLCALAPPSTGRARARFPLPKGSGIRTSSARQQKRTPYGVLVGVLGGIRTPDPLVRSQILYPTELQAHLYSLFLNALIIITHYF